MGIITAIIPALFCVKQIVPCKDTRGSFSDILSEEQFIEQERNRLADQIGSIEYKSTV